MEVSITCTGLQELISKLEQLPERLTAFISEEATSVGEEIVSHMQSDAPVLTGFLRDNIGITASNQYAVQVASLAYYSVFIEFGTSKMNPQPFFFSNAVQGGNEFFTRLQAYLQSIL